VLFFVHGGRASVYFMGRYGQTIILG